MKRKLANLIYHARQEKNLSQAAVAEKLNITIPTFLKMEQGKGNVGINTYDKVIKFFNLKVLDSRTRKAEKLLLTALERGMNEDVDYRNVIGHAIELLTIKTKV